MGTLGSPIELVSFNLILLESATSVWIQLGTQCIGPKLLSLYYTKWKEVNWYIQFPTPWSNWGPWLINMFLRYGGYILALLNEGCSCLNTDMPSKVFNGTTFIT